MKLILTITIMVVVVTSSIDFDRHVLDDRFIKHHNSKRLSWTAKRNHRFEGVTVGEVVNMLGTKKPMDTPHDAFFMTGVKGPTSFDSRTQWPGCVHDVMNQGKCGSCWAFASSQSLSDRLCIASHGKINVTLSPQSLVSCDTVENYGCNGGYPQMAWKYMETKGLPTDSCFPYVSGVNGTETDCQVECEDGSQYRVYQAKPNTLVTCNSEDCIKQQILSYGPMVGTFLVYDDFMSYSSGVYVRTAGSQSLGGHAIQIIGWGRENGQDYWLCKNSWSNGWGIDGLFKILRGSNMVGIERNASASRANV